MLPTDKDDDQDDKFVINFFRGNKKVILDVLDWEITRLVVTRQLKVIVKVCCWTLQSYATMFSNLWCIDDDFAKKEATPTVIK